MTNSHDDFRSKIFGSTTDGSGVLSTLDITLRKTEIGNSDITLTVQKDVFGLQTMKNEDDNS